MPADRDPSARKRLPVKPSAEHLRKQAKRLAKSRGVALAAAQHALAKEYGAKNWGQLMHIVETMNRGAGQLISVKYEYEALPKAANQNDLERVKAILATGEFTQHDLDLGLARSLRKDRRAIAELLIEHGADPNGQYGSDYGPIVFVTGESLDPDSLQLLIDHGADVTFGPVDTKYGRQCPLSYFLGSYVRGSNEAKHRGIEILLRHGAHVPAEVTPEILALHRGDVAGLAALLDREPALVKKKYPEMPYGNLLLKGGTLLHAAVEFGELEVMELLLERGADVNARSGPFEMEGRQVEGPTPVFHGIATNHHHVAPLKHLLQRAAGRIDFTLKAGFRLSDGGAILPEVTALEYARLALREPTPEWRRSTAEEIALLEQAMGQSTAGSVSEGSEGALVQTTSGMSAADAFLLSATPESAQDHKSGNLARAEGILREHPGLSTENFHAACALGDVAALERHLQRDRGLARSAGGPRGWPALCYLTFSRYLRLDAKRSADFVRAAEVLLDQGADPNAFWPAAHDANYREAALYGAAGIANHAELTRLLLARGADPNDDESLYHASEFENNAALAVLLDHPRLDKGRMNYCLCHKLDFEHPAGLRLFLEHGADPNYLIDGGQRKGDRPLHFALVRHRSAGIVELLLDGGADPDLPNSRGVRPFELAMKLGRLEVVDLLRGRGAKMEASAKLQLLAALSTGDERRARELVVEHPRVLGEVTPEDHTLLVDAAANGNDAAVGLMLAEPFGFPVDVQKPRDAAWDGTALHHACYHGHPETVRLLLERGADPQRKHAYGGNAFTTTVHAALHNDPKRVPEHLRTLTLLASRFDRQTVERSIEHAREAGRAEVAAHLETLRGGATA